MDRLTSMRVFLRVIDEGSFAAAARALDMSPAVVTRLVADLEDHLGTRLLHRTTRRQSLTDAGEAYLERVRHILQDLDDAHSLVSSHTHTAINNALNAIAPHGVPLVKVGRSTQSKALDAGITMVENLKDWHDRPERPGQGYVVGATPFATCSKRLQHYSFDTVVFDEASQITLPLALMACSNAEGPKTVSATPAAKSAEKAPVPFPSTYKAYPGVATAIRNVTVYDGEGGKIDNGVVFMTQSMCQRFKVRVIVGIVLVGLKKRYNTWRCCIHKNLFCTVYLCGIFHTLNVIVKRALIFHCNWAHTTRSSVRGCATSA